MEKQLVVFNAGTGEFGIDIASVESIIKPQRVTKIPQAAPCMEGIINLRGSVLPVFNLARRLELPVQEKTRDTRIMVVLSGETKLGMIVSAVSEVLTVENNAIEPPPPLVSGINSEYVDGVVKIDSRLILLLDLTKLLSLTVGSRLPMSLVTESSLI